MELKKQSIHMNYEKGRAVSQITLDDDFNLPDYKPDIVRIMKTKGEIHFEEVRVSEGHLQVKGTLDFVILYRSDQSDRKIDSLCGSISFTENLIMDGVTELDPVHMTADMEDLTIGIINSRKLNIRALVMLTGHAGETRAEEIITDVWDEDALEIKKENRNVLQLIECKRDNFRFREELQIPSSKPNIRDILWKSVQLRGVESRLRNNSIELTGEILVYLLYLGEEDSEHLQWIEMTVPLTGSVPCGNCAEDLIYRIQSTPRTIELEVRPDYDGEQRMLSLDMVLDLFICLWQEENVEMVKDLYSLKQQLVPQYEEGILPQFVTKNYAKCKITDQIQLEKEQENILQICACEGRVSVDNQTVEEDGVRVEGTLEVELMYITTDDTMPIGTLKGLLAFSQLVEAPGVQPQCEIGLEAGIEQLSAMLIDNTQVEIKASLNLNLIVFSNQRMQKLSDVTVGEDSMESLQKQPGIVGYIVKPDDTLWSIAKNNHTTIAELIHTNQLESQEVQGGEKLLIVKSV